MTATAGASGHPEALHDESRWWTSAAMVAVGLLHLLLPEQIAALRSPEIVGVVVVVLAVVQFVARDETFTRRRPVLWGLSLVLLTVVIVANTVSLVLLVRSIVVHGDLSASNLLLGGAVVWLTNVAAFGFVYWEWDRGGPVARVEDKADPRAVDLQFPQMTDPALSATFVPWFVDYLYVSFTNSIAFSPTDTMPLTRRCKALFALQAVISFVTVGLVAARAVNVLPS